MFKKAMNWIFANRKKEAHILVAVAGAIGTTWSASAGFRTAVTHELALMPHWIQGLGAVLAFAIPIWKVAQKTLASETAAQ
jgi:hypothetical protein